MKTLSPFFMIGTVGMILTAFMHIIMTVFILQTANHGAWIGGYPVFLAFLMIGAIQIYKKKILIK